MKICSCPSPFDCKVLADNNMKLIKVVKKTPKAPCPHPAGATASIVPPESQPFKKRPMVKLRTLIGNTVTVVDTGSIDSGDDYRWQGAEEDRNYTLSSWLPACSVRPRQCTNYERFFLIDRGMLKQQGCSY